MATSKETVILVDGDSLKYSQAIKLGQIAKERNMKINLVSKVPEIPAAFYQVPSTTKIEQDLITATEKKLARLAQVLQGVHTEQKAVREHDKDFQEIAKELNAQLILNGCHESLLERFRQFLKRKTTKANDHMNIPSMKVSEYLDIVQTIHRETVKQQCVAIQPVKVDEAADTNSSGGLFSWLSARSQDMFAHETLCKPGKQIRH